MGSPEVTPRARRHLVSTLVIIVSAGSLGVAAYVRPDPHSPGTVPQLFPECAMGTHGPVRCPTCGLTSGVAALLRGQVVEGATRNLLAPVVLPLLVLGLWFGGFGLLARRPMSEAPGWSLVATYWPMLVIAGLSAWLAMQLRRA